jgi:uncharacterized protein (TIGR02246 family)
MPRLSIVAALCLAAAAAAAQEPAEPAAAEGAPPAEAETAPTEPPKFDVRDAVDAGNYFFRKAFEARDAKAIAELYTEDARVIAPGAEPVDGREAIAAFWAGAMEAAKSVRLETRSVESDGNLAFEDGVVHLTAPDGSESSERYLVVWKRVGRRWHLHRDIWNAGSSTEPTAAEPPVSASPDDAPPVSTP